MKIRTGAFVLPCTMKKAQIHKECNIFAARGLRSMMRLPEFFVLFVMSLPVRQIWDKQSVQKSLLIERLHYSIIKSNRRF